MAENALTLPGRRELKKWRRPLRSPQIIAGRRRLDAADRERFVLKLYIEALVDDAPLRWVRQFKRNLEATIRSVTGLSRGDAAGHRPECGATTGGAN